MNVYYVRARHSKHAKHEFAFLLYTDVVKKDAAIALASRGWLQPKVSPASFENISDTPREDAVIEWIRKDLAEQKRAVEAAALKKAQDEKLEALRTRLAREERERQHQAARESAQERAIGDIVAMNLEPKLMGNQRLASICAKVSLFFDQSGVNKRDIFTAISLDFAEFQGRTSFPNANRLLKQVVNELNEYMLADAEALKLIDALRDDRHLANDTINSIASRTHVYGGSGAGLFLSMWIASDNVKRDERQIGSIEAQYKEREYKVRQALDRINIHQQLLEHRAKVSVSLLLNACGKSDTIDLTLPMAIEMHLLG